MSRRGSFNVRPSHPLCGVAVVVKLHTPHPLGQIKSGSIFVIEDWVENVNGKRWTAEVLGGNFAAIHYGQRAVANNRELYNGFEPIDDVVYGKVGLFGYMLHNSELGEVKK